MAGYTIENNKKERSLALVITIALHLAFILFLWFKLVNVPDPPLDSFDGGMVVNLGYVDEATGNIVPMSESEKEPIVTNKQMQQTDVAQAKIVTQSIEESVKIKTSESESKDPVKENVNTEVKTETKVEALPQVDPATLYKGKKNGVTSQGNSNKGTGDQGDPNGNVNSNYYGPGGKGTSPGPGDDDGPPGNGKGGPSYSMAGRKAQALPVPNFNIQEEGKVVVEIVIDRSGNVIKANPGVRGSTTTSTYLLNKAKESALKAKFTANPDAPEEQRGTIVYNFFLK